LAFNLNIPIIRKNVDICLFSCATQGYAKGKVVANPEAVIMLGELKGGIDPAGADEHWKTANTALSRIRSGFESVGHLGLKTSFVGAAIATAMAGEIYQQLQNKTLSNAANLTEMNQLTEYCNWVIEL